MNPREVRTQYSSTGEDICPVCGVFCEVIADSNCNLNIHGCNHFIKADSLYEHKKLGFIFYFANI